MRKWLLTPLALLPVLLLPEAHAESPEAKGLAIAEELARQGAHVVINSFTNSENDHQLAKRIAAAHGASVVYRQADMARPEQCRELIEFAAAEFGSVDILVNNAGIQHVAPVEEFPTERWDAILAINLSAAFHTSAVAVPLMRDRGWGAGVRRGDVSAA